MTNSLLKIYSVTVSYTLSTRDAKGGEEGMMLSKDQSDQLKDAMLAYALSVLKGERTPSDEKTLLTVLTLLTAAGF